jgi:hypothetical protein
VKGFYQLLGPQEKEERRKNDGWGLSDGMVMISYSPFLLTVKTQTSILDCLLLLLYISTPRTDILWHKGLNKRVAQRIVLYFE